MNVSYNILTDMPLPTQGAWVEISHFVLVVDRRSRFIERGLKRFI